MTQEELNRLKKMVLTMLIRNDVDIMPGAYVAPISNIVRFLKEPKKDIKKALEGLKDDGLVEYTYDGGWNEKYERPYCMWGYVISKKVTEMPQYLEERKREEDWWRDSLRFESEVRCNESCQ